MTDEVDPDRGPGQEKPLPVRRSARRAIPATRKAVYAALMVVALFLTAELVLWLFGVDTMIAREDPSSGFSGLVSVYAREGETYRTRPSLRGRTFNDQSFPVRKRNDEVRIFCLGGSSAFGFPWDAKASFSGVLEDVLTAAGAGRTFKVINVAGISYAMHRLNIVADEILNYDPDVFVIYSGHNEFVERSFYRALAERGQARNRVMHAMAHTRVCGALHQLFVERGKAAGSRRNAFDMSVRREQTYRYSAAETEAIVEDFRDGIGRLVRSAQQRGVRVIVSTVPCNLRQWRPRVSVAHISAGVDHGTWGVALRDGRQKVEAGRFQEAIGELERALDVAPHHAETHFLLARAREGLGQWDRARRSYEAACDHDASPNRRVSGINEAIREVARRDRVVLVDSERVFREQSEHGLVGFNLIEDYVHPNEKGHQIIAWELWRAMAGEGWLGDAASVNRELFDRVVANRTTASAEANAIWHFNQGVILENQSQWARAIDKYQRAVELEPNLPLALHNLARLLHKQGEPQEASRYVDQLLKIAPDHAQGRVLCGNLFADQQRWDDAIKEYRRAVAAADTPIAAYNQMGVALAKKGDLDGAVTAFEQAIRINPSYAEAHYNLGNAFLFRDQLDQAEDHYERAVRLRPDHPKSRHNLGMVCVRKKLWRKAEAHFQEAILLKPDYAIARDNLARVRAAIQEEPVE